MLIDTPESGAHLLPPIEPACLCRDASVSARNNDVRALDDKQRSVSAPDGRLLAAKSERVRLSNTAPNFRARALIVLR
jgi:hypothetical protein